MANQVANRVTAPEDDHPATIINSSSPQKKKVGSHSHTPECENRAHCETPSRMADSGGRRSTPAFLDRVTDMMYVCGPLSWPSLFATPEDLQSAAAVIARPETASPDAVLAARRLRSAVLHPDSLEPIPLPFRMAAHVPVNTVLLLGMLTATTPLGTGAWQFANATFNALQFYANRNASNPVSDSQLAASYIGAMASSVCVGVALRYATRAPAASPPPSWRLRAAQLAVPFLAAAAGKPLQIGLMRADEVASGVAVFDEDGAARGVSRVAGAAAIGMTLAVRVVYLAPMLYLPLIQAALVRRVALLRSRPGLAAQAVCYTGITALSSALVTPVCMALFDQWASLPVSVLEPELQALVRIHRLPVSADSEGSLSTSPGSPGEPVRRLFFNKGL